MLFITLLINVGFSFYLLRENQRNKQDIEFLENKIDRLDIDTLEKIKGKNEVDINCEDIENGNWITDTLCS